MAYIENPKTKGSGILCAIPQSDGRCPRSCSDCFFMSGRSYLEPHEKNLPNMPPPCPKSPSKAPSQFVVRINDGLDSVTLSGSERYKLENTYPNLFYNTSVDVHLDTYAAPVVVTINPDYMTDTDFTRLEKPPENLMYVRFRANVWNRRLLDEAIAYYTLKGVRVVITFMAYFHDSEIIKTINDDYSLYYEFKKRTLNSYWCINQAGWNLIYGSHRDNALVSTCGRDASHHKCSDCGVCLREYFKTKARLAGI